MTSNAIQPGISPENPGASAASSRHFDMAALSAEERYRLLASSILPRPVAWVVTCDDEGKVNAAPFSFFNMFGADKPVIALGLMPREGELKDTVKNILATKEFVVNLVSAKLAPMMNETSINSPHGINELELARIESAPSKSVRPPRIAASPASFECTLMHHLETGPRQFLLVGEIRHAYFADDALSGDPARPRIAAEHMDLIARMHGPTAYAYTRSMFDLVRPVWTTGTVPSSSSTAGEANKD